MVTSTHIASTDTTAAREPTSVEASFTETEWAAAGS